MKPLSFTEARTVARNLGKLAIVFESYRFCLCSEHLFFGMPHFLICPVCYKLNCWCALFLQGSKARGPLDSSSGSVDLEASVSSNLSSTNKVSKACDARM